MSLDKKAKMVHQITRKEIFSEDNGNENHDGFFDFNIFTLN